MAFAFGHLIFAWFIGKISLKIERIEWFFLLFGALFPDGDYFIDWIFGLHIHRTFTHSLFMAAVGFLIVYFVFYFLDTKINGKRIGLFFAAGIFSHLILDMIIGYPGVGLLWPLDYRFWFFGFMENYISLSFNETPLPVLIWRLKLAIFDMGIGVLWIGYLFFKGKLKEF